MSGTVVTKLRPEPTEPQIIVLTPERAMELLEHNTLNRPLNDQHVQRISRQITDGKWQFNGDTIKIAKTGDVLDGQHRLWAVVEAKKPVKTILVYGIEREAFSTIDTLRKPRSGADVLALNGVARYRMHTSAALCWLLRWQRSVTEDWRAPQNKIENSDIEAAFAVHPGVVRAVERSAKLRGLANPGVVGFLYYVITNRNSEIAERMMDTLENPAGVGVNDPFFRLRLYFTSDHHKQKDPIVTIALTIKAANAAASDKKVQVLNWKSQGKQAEQFPKLEV